MNRLNDALTPCPDGPVWVGVSGGLDSMVLLHLLAQQAGIRARGLTALHVCHGLHPDADHWAKQVEAFCRELGVGFQRVDVTVTGIDWDGVEAAARRARYEAFRAHVPAGGGIALAHHRDDQVETVLLRLLHGAGFEGMAGMRIIRPLFQNDARWLWRPFLSLPRSLLHDYAMAHGLRWIEDPANTHPDFIRNRLRHRVVPLLRELFPEAETRICAAASRWREEAEALENVARQWLLTHASTPENGLPCVELRALPKALVRQGVGIWLDQQGLPRPPRGIWEALLPELVNAREDGTPTLQWAGGRLRRYQDRLFADSGQKTGCSWECHWDGRSPLALPEIGATLAFDPPLARAQHFVVRSRRGGEVLQWRGHRRSLKKLLQAAHLPPWERERLPLLLNDQGELLAVAGCWQSDMFRQWQQDAHTQLHLYYD